MFRARLRAAGLGLALIVGAVAALAGSALPVGATAGQVPQAQEAAIVLAVADCSEDLATGELICVPDGERATEQVLCPGELLGLRASTGPNRTGDVGHHCVPRQCSVATGDLEGPRFKGNFRPRFTNNISWVNTFNQCDVRLFNLDNQQGAASVWIDGPFNLADIENGLNNRANSFRLS